MRILLTVLMTALICFGCGNTGSQQSTEMKAIEEAAHLTHQNYVNAINSNDLDSVMAMFTEDVVFLYPKASPIIGKENLRPWIGGYLKAFKTYWDKPVQEFVVNGKWAFGRYSYKSTDTSLSDGSVIEGTGWGLIIYHYDTDGKWKVARDAWGPDTPPSE